MTQDSPPSWDTLPAVGSLRTAIEVWPFFQETTFADQLRYARGHWRLSQRDLARSLGITGSYLNDIEHGRRAPSIKFLERFLAFYVATEPKADTKPRILRLWTLAAIRAHGWDI